MKITLTVGKERIDVSEFELDLIDAQLAAASGALIDVSNAEEREICAAS